MSIITANIDGLGSPVIGSGVMDGKTLVSENTATDVDGANSCFALGLFFFLT
jgi:hypothetical protein